MLETLHPGVYIEEVSEGPRSIEAVATSTAGFIGIAKKGPVKEATMLTIEPTFITSYTEFEANFGGFQPEEDISGGGTIKYYLAPAVYQFFRNGGKRCYILRVTDGTHATSHNSDLINGTDDDDNSLPGAVTIEATSPGKWGDDIEVLVEPGSLSPIEVDLSNGLSGEYKLIVNYRSNGVKSTVETFDNLSLDENKSNFMETIVNRASNYITVDVAAAAKTLNHEGVIRIRNSPPTDLSVSIKPVMRNDLGAQVRVNISTNATDPALYDFEVEYDDGTGGPFVSIDTLTGVSPDPDDTTNSIVKRMAQTGVNISDYISVQLHGQTTMETGNWTIKAYKLGGGDNGLDDISASDYTAALTDFDNADQTVNIIAIPGDFSGGTGSSNPDDSSDQQSNVISSGLAYCQNKRYSFFIADVGKDFQTASGAATFVDNLPTKNAYGAVYYPWITAPDPAGVGKNPTREYPPSGFVAGIYAKTDTTRGVWKAPAGIETRLAGVSELVVNTTDPEQDILNPRKVNVIRRFSGAGFVVWGARTLSADALWRYVPIRRFTNFLEESLEAGTQFAVFEPNDEPLWSALRLSIRAFMMTLFRQGAFQGDSPQSAFFVKCDSENNPQVEIDAGKVNVDVGFAPLKPAEFVVIRITQKTLE